MQGPESIARASFDAAPQGLEGAIARCEEALEAFDGGPEGARPGVLEVLLARDALARAVADRSA